MSTTDTTKIEPPRFPDYDFAKPTARLIHRGPWLLLVGVSKCLCPDGVRRYATITAEADTFFSVPASVNVGGLTVSGYVTQADTADGTADWQFRPNSWGRNAFVFPQVGQ